MTEEEQIDELSEDLAYQPPPTPTIAARNPPPHLVAGLNGEMDEPLHPSTRSIARRNLEHEIEGLRNGFRVLKELCLKKGQTIERINMQYSSLEGYVAHLEKQLEQKDEAISSLLKMLATAEELRAQGIP